VLAVSQAERRRLGRPPGADGEETRARILFAARRVFSTTGFDRASLAQIALEAGITRNAISNYYPNKVELHRAAFASIARDVLAVIMSDLPGPEAPAMTRIMALFRSAVRMNETDSSFVRFWVTSTIDAVRHPELRDQSERQFAAVRRFFHEALEEGRARGEIAAGADTKALAQVIVDLLWGLAMDSGFQSDAARVQQALTALEMLLTGAVVRR
jgi:AcrR family transcriptional regulator